MTRDEMIFREFIFGPKPVTFPELTAGMWTMRYYVAVISCGWTRWVVTGEDLFGFQATQSPCREDQLPHRLSCKPHIVRAV